jgi:hypothetical protein
MLPLLPENALYSAECRGEHGRRCDEMDGWRQSAGDRKRVYRRASTERIDSPAVELLRHARGGGITVADHRLTAVWKAQRRGKALRFVASKAAGYRRLGQLNPKRQLGCGRDL